jgi:hypothetical protein
MSSSLSILRNPMETFRQIQKSEITELTVTHITPLVIISEGKLHNQKVVLYELRYVKTNSEELEQIILDNNILFYLQSEFLLIRIGFIENPLTQSLTFVYNYPDNHTIFTLDKIPFKTEEEKTLNYLSKLKSIYHLVYLIKKKNNNFDLGCILNPYMFFLPFDSEKPLSLVDCVYTVFFKKVNNPLLHNLCGYFKNKQDEIVLSLILMANFFNENKETFNEVNAVQIYMNLYNSDLVESYFDYLSNGKISMITKPNIVNFIKDVMYKKIENKNTYSYSQFYRDFISFYNSYKKEYEQISNINVNQNDNTTKNKKEDFYSFILQKNKSFDQLKKAKTDLEIIYSYLPESNEMLYSKHIDETFLKETQEMIDSKEKSRNKIEEIFNNNLNTKINTFNTNIKKYLSYKLKNINRNEKDSKEKLLQFKSEVENIITLVNNINNFSKNYSLLLNLDGEGNQFLSTIDLINNRVLPPLFEENKKLMMDFPKSIQLNDEINYLLKCPYIQDTNTAIFSYIHAGDSVVDLFFNENKMKLQVEFDKELIDEMEINAFLHESKWLTFDSFIFVTGGYKVDEKEPQRLNLVVDLSKKDITKVYGRQNMPFNKIHHSMCKISNYSFIVVGGSNERCAIFSILTNQWKAVPNVSYCRINGMLALINDVDLYYFGGKEESNTIDYLVLGEIENVENTVWSSITINNSISLMNCIYLHKQQKLILLGGKDSENDYNSKTYLLDIGEKTIEEIENKLTFNIEYEFIENKMIRSLNNKLLHQQVGLNGNNEVILLSIDEKMFE